MPKHTTCCCLLTGVRGPAVLAILPRVCPSPAPIPLRNVPTKTQCLLQKPAA